MIGSRFIGLPVLVIALGACSADASAPPVTPAPEPLSNGDAAPPPVSDGGSGTDASQPTNASVAAATQTANTNTLCTAVSPFYWEIGDKDAPLASGAVGASAPTATTLMPIASASKWIFGAYVVEKMAGNVAPADVPMLNFTSGYAGFAGDSCPNMGTIDDCLAGAAGQQIPADVGKYDYNGAHLQKLASVMGLGAMSNAALGTEVRSQIGTEINVNYSQPQPAGGIYTSADQYVLFLRKLLVGSSKPLRMGAMLAADSVCTNPVTCPTAVYSPIPGNPNSTESWHYGLAHWIEDDPKVGDGAFSSAGKFGFYPWVNADRTLYGVLARKDTAGRAGYDSALCGRLIRKAFVTGVAQ